LKTLITNGPEIGGAYSQLSLYSFIHENLNIFDVFAFCIPVNPSLLQKLKKTTSPTEVYVLKIELLITEGAVLLESIVGRNVGFDSIWRF